MDGSKLIYTCLLQIQSYTKLLPHSLLPDLNLLERRQPPQADRLLLVVDLWADNLNPPQDIYISHILAQRIQEEEKEASHTASESRITHCRRSVISLGMAPSSLMSAQSPASDLSPRAHASSVATTYSFQHQSPPTPTEAHILASMSREGRIMEFSQPQYQPPSVPRSVKFELVTDTSQYRARLPMRVQIYPHDTTESIITTVKNFYGLYPSPTSCPGVSFEDEQGNTIIGRYENFRHNSVVYVRVRDGPPTPGPHTAQPTQPGARSFYTQDGHPVQGPQQQTQHMSRPASRSSRRRSVTPNSISGRRSAAGSTHSKNVRPRSNKSRGPGSQTQGDTQNESMNGYSSGNDAPGSASGKSKEQIPSTEISLDNIVEGGRRKRAKFESSVSELNDSSSRSLKPSRGS